MRKIFTCLLTLALIGPPTAAFADSPLVPSTPVMLVGSFGAGSTVSALYPQDDQTITPSFEWFADGTSIAGAQTANLVLGNNLVGKLISAKVTLTKTGFTNLVSDVAGARVFASLPTGGGTMTFGDETANTPGCFSPRASGVATPTIGWNLFFSCNPYNTNFGSPVEQRFWWYRNGQVIDGANQSSYRLQATDAGQAIWGAFRATYSNGFVYYESKKLRSSVPFQIVLTKPTVGGSQSTGSVLTASTAGSDSLASLSYQWFSDYAPISGATSASYTVRSSDIGKAVQVLVVAERNGFTPTSSLSDPVAGSNFQPANAMDAYSKVFNGYRSTSTNYDISYIVSPNVTPTSLAREKALIQKAADFWLPEYTPSGVTVLYVTKDDATWAEGVISQRPSWGNRIPGGIRSWIESNSCGFALAFKADDRQVFIQCVRNGSESTLNDQQVGPHEYSHWVQYEQTSDLYLGTVPWLIEGQANFYGLALGVAPEDSILRFVNRSIAGQAAQYDIYNGYRFADFKMLDLFQSGNIFDVQTMLSRSGTVWDHYAVGTLTSEWLVSKYGHQKYVDWMKALLRNQGNSNDSERAANATAFSASFGFEYSQLGLHITPYFAARAVQLRNDWFSNVQAQPRVTLTPPLAGPIAGPIGAPISGPVPPGPQSPNSAARTTKPTSSQLPAFTAKATTLSAIQKALIVQKIKSASIRQVTCTALYSSKTSAKDITIYKLRAKNTCAYAKASLSGLGRAAAISVTSTKTTKSAEVGKVNFSLK
jgi:hypothetical protein